MAFKLLPFRKTLTTLVVIAFLLTIFFAYFWFRGGRHYGKRREGFSGSMDVPYSAFPNNAPVDFLAGNLLKGGDKVSCSTIEGQSGIFCSGPRADAPIDPFYGNKSNMDCEGSGLTRAGGNVCLTPDQRKLLTTRGGNSALDAQIGGPCH